MATSPEDFLSQVLGSDEDTAATGDNTPAEDDGDKEEVTAGGNTQPTPEPEPAPEPEAKPEAKPKAARKPKTAPKEEPKVVVGEIVEDEPTSDDESLSPQTLREMEAGRMALAKHINPAG